MKLILFQIYNTHVQFLSHFSQAQKIRALDSAIQRQRVSPIRRLFSHPFLLLQRLFLTHSSAYLPLNQARQFPSITFLNYFWFRKIGWEKSQELQCHYSLCVVRSQIFCFTNLLGLNLKFLIFSHFLVGATAANFPGMRLFSLTLYDYMKKLLILYIFYLDRLDQLLCSYFRHFISYMAD